MNQFLVAMLLVTMSASAAWAVDLQVTWDANTETDLAGYRLYQRGDGEGYVLEPGNAVADVAAPATDTVLAGFPDDGKTYYWVLTAYDTSGNESGPSNEASYTTSDKVAPGTPNLRGVVEIPTP